MTHREFTWYFPPNEDGQEPEQEQEAGYQGWANWDTWNAHLWLTNDYDLYKKVLRWIDAHRGDMFGSVCLNGVRADLMDCEQLGDQRRDGKAWDGIDFDAVDWKAVVTSFQEDLEH